MKLHSPDCPDWQASIVITANGRAKLIIHTEAPVYINDNKVTKSQILIENDIISFCGIETFKYVTNVPIIDADPIETFFDTILLPD